MPRVLVVSGQIPRIKPNPPRAGASLSAGGFWSGGGGGRGRRGACPEALPGRGTAPARDEPPPLPGRVPALISHGPERLSPAICSPGHQPNRGDKLLTEPQLERARGAGAEGAEAGYRREGSAGSDACGQSPGPSSAAGASRSG